MDKNYINEDLDIESVNIKNIKANNLASGLTVNRVNEDAIAIQVKGVESVINSIDENSINAYINLSDYQAGTYEVDVNIENNDPRITYVATSKVKVVITNN